MNLRRRIERIERQLDRQPKEQEDGPSVVDRLLVTPIDELTPREPELDPRALTMYYSFTLAHLSFSRERPEFYSGADLDQWRARQRHAESLVEALEERDETCDIRAHSVVTMRVCLVHVRYQFTGEVRDQIPV